MEAQLEQIDAWNLEKDFAPITPALEKLLAEHPEDAEVIYRQARHLYQLATEEADVKQKEKLVRQAVDVCAGGLEKHPDHALLHKWMAITLGK